MRVHFLAQGRTDSILIIHNGKAMFIDGGYRKNGLNAVKYMRNHGIETLDRYIVTHGHKNHCECAGIIVSEMNPKFIEVNRRETWDAMKNFAKKGAERNALIAYEGAPKSSIPASVVISVIGSTFTLGGLDARFKILGPSKMVKCTTGQYKENSNSLIIKMEYKGHSMLLTGDTTAAILKGIEKKTPGILRADVLKNPHHNGALPLDLVKTIDPIWTVICNGKLPAKKYQNVLKQASLHWAVAGKGDKANGDVILSFTENGIASVDS